MNKNVMWMALVLACSSSLAMADISLNFLYDSTGQTSPNRAQASDGQDITLDFFIDGAGDVLLDATPEAGGTHSTFADYAAAVESWDGNVGTVDVAALWGTSFQITVFADTVVQPENLTLDDTRGAGNPGSIGIGGQNASRVDIQTTSGNGFEFLHFAQTGGTAQINLLAFGWHGQSDGDGIYDTRLIAGSVDNDFINMGSGNIGTEDVSALGYVIGSGANDLIFRMPDAGGTGIGVTGLTLEVVPEPASFSLLAVFGAAMLLSRRRFMS